MNAAIAIWRARGAALLSCGFWLQMVGCAPYRLWVGKSPDREHQAEVWSKPGRQFVRLDGRDGPQFSDVGIGQLSWSPDNSGVAYAANTRAGWVVSAQGRLSGPWVGIGEIVWSPDGKHIAYSAQEKQFWTVVTDFRMGEYYDEVKARSIVFSPSGARLGYVVEDGRSIRVVVDDRPGPKFDGIGDLTFSGDSHHYLYLARRGDAVFLVIDDEISESYESIADLVVGPTGFHWAVLALAQSQWHAVVDGVMGSPFQSISSPVFSPDGKHIAYYARRGEKALVVNDTRESALYDEIAPFSVAFDQESRHLVFVARREKSWRVVMDDVAGPEYDFVSNPVVAGDSLAYIAGRGKERFAVINGVEGPRGSHADNLVSSADGRHHAYFVKKDGETFLVLDSAIKRLAFAVVGTLVISADGRHWACLIANEERKKFYVTIDGEREVPLELQEWLGAIKFDLEQKGIDGFFDQTAVVRRWVSAELERAIRVNPSASLPATTPSNPQ